MLRDSCSRACLKRLVTSGAELSRFLISDKLGRIQSCIIKVILTQWWPPPSTAPTRPLHPWSQKCSHSKPRESNINKETTIYTARVYKNKLRPKMLPCGVSRWRILRTIGSSTLFTIRLGPSTSLWWNKENQHCHQTPFNSSSRKSSLTTRAPTWTNPGSSKLLRPLNIPLAVTNWGSSSVTSGEASI